MSELEASVSALFFLEAVVRCALFCLDLSLWKAVLR